MSNFRRRLMSKLTKDPQYTELEYLESTGIQYIDTNIMPTNNMGINVKYKYHSNGSAAICGTFYPKSPRRDVFFVSSESGLTTSNLFATHRGITGSGKEQIELNKDYNCKINYLNDGKIYFNEQFFENIGTNELYPATILLFARLNASNNNIAISNSDIYYIEFTEGDKITHKFIPVLDKDGIPCMYDKIGKKFYYNQGTGKFLYGLKNGYVGDGAVLYLDGINNTLKGHDENSSIWEDLSGNKNNGELVNYVTNDWTEKGLTFKNINGVYLGNFLSNLFNNDCTIEFCLNFSGEKTRGVIIGNYSYPNSINIEIANTSQFRLYWNSGEYNHYSEANFFEVNNTMLMTMTLNKSEGIVNIYKNGQLFQTFTDNMFTNYQHLYNVVYIGKDSRTTATTSFNGIINSVRIYEKMLNEEEILTNYEIDKTRFEIIESGE